MLHLPQFADASSLLALTHPRNVDDWRMSRWMHLFSKRCPSSSAADLTTDRCVRSFSAHPRRSCPLECMPLLT